MDASLLVAIFLVLMLLGVPLATALGTAGLVVLGLFDYGYQMVGVNFISSIASFPLLAIPFFILAGMILKEAGLARIVSEFFEALLGDMRGGLALVAVATCVAWGALSGSGPATTAAVGLILVSPMVRQGYRREFAAALVANASDLSIVIPPSIAFIIYGNITGTSVAALFLGGIIPGILTAAALMAVAGIISRRRGYGRGNVRRRYPLGQLFRRAFWALLTPVIILGGIYSGIFTPTEAAVVAVVYSIAISTVIYRSLTWNSLFRALVYSSTTTGAIMFLVSFAGIFSWAASTTGLIDAASHMIVNLSSNRIVLILLVDLLLLILGMFLDAISISYILMPVLIPVLAAFHIDPVWYGVIFVSALAIGQATPPVGVNLYTAAALVNTEVDPIAREAIPFVLGAAVVLIVISLFPQLSLFIPRLAGLH